MPRKGGPKEDCFPSPPIDDEETMKRKAKPSPASEAGMTPPHSQEELIAGIGGMNLSSPLPTDDGPAKTEPTDNGPAKTEPTDNDWEQIVPDGHVLLSFILVREERTGAARNPRNPNQIFAPQMSMYMSSPQCLLPERLDINNRMRKDLFLLNDVPNQSARRFQIIAPLDTLDFGLPTVIGGASPGYVGPKLAWSTEAAKAKKRAENAQYARDYQERQAKKKNKQDI